MKKISMRSGSFLLIPLFLAAQALMAQSALDKAIRQMAVDGCMKHAGLSICVVDVQSGKIIAAHDPHRCLMPASSLKIATTAAALDVLGRDFRFKTELQYDGTIAKGGILNGNLYLRGYGDPTLGSDRFEDTPNLKTLMARFQQAVQGKGICRINGLVVGDESYYGTEAHPPSWQLNDVGNYYGVGAWGLNIHENFYYLHFRQSPKSGERPRIIGTSPLIPNLLLNNEVRSSDMTEDNAYVFASPYSNVYFVRGTIPAGNGHFVIRGAIPDPPYLAAHTLLKTLEKSGIATRRQATSQFELNREGSKRKSRTTLYTHESPPVASIVKRTNMESNNLYCEALLKAIGKKKFGQGYNYDGVVAVANYWRDQGIDLDGFVMEDGSGLSPRNAASSYHLAAILRQIARNERIFSDFYESLPETGKSGPTLGMLRNTRAAGRVRTKTGTMKTVRSYTGYARTEGGKLLAFSIIANNFAPWGKLRELTEKIMIEMCRH